MQWYSSGNSNKKLNPFLERFSGIKDFIIGAICSGPMFLAQAGLLKEKKYTDSLFVEMRDQFSFIEEDNFEAAPVVEAGNIITAQGSAFNDFAVHVARKLGYECPDKILSGYMDNWKKRIIFTIFQKKNYRNFKKNFRNS